MVKLIKDEIREEIKKFAKELYMIPNSNGSHKYSIAFINDLVWNKFGKQLKTKYNNETIRLWSKKRDFSGCTWESEYKACVAIGITPDKVGNEDKNVFELFNDEIAKNIRKSYKLNSESNVGAISFLQLWQKICHEKIKELSISCGGISSITKEDFDDNFDRDDKRLMMELKKDSDVVLDKLRNNSDITNKVEVDNTFKGLPPMKIEVIDKREQVKDED